VGRRQTPQADQVFDRHLVGHDQIGPRLSQLDPPFKMFGAIVDALHAILGHVSQPVHRPQRALRRQADGPPVGGADEGMMPVAMQSW
jgi:hypothetical protein